MYLPPSTGTVVVFSLIYAKVKRSEDDKNIIPETANKISSRR